MKPEMREHLVERLVRQALEVDALERAAFAERPAVLRLPGWARWGVAVASAAACTLFWAWAPSPQGSGPTDRQTRTPRDAAGLVESSSQREIFLALFRVWSRDCECLAWEAHRWQGPPDAARLAAEREPLETGFDASETPPGGQFVLVSLPTEKAGRADREATHELLACLNTSAPHADLNEPVECSAGAVEQCLPEGAHVLVALRD